MRQPFFEDLMTAMYPSGLLHTFGVNGKISGSVGAVGEMQEVLPSSTARGAVGFTTAIPPGVGTSPFTAC